MVGWFETEPEPERARAHGVCTSARPRDGAARRAAMRRNAETTVTSARPRTIGATTLERLHSDLKELGNGDGGVGELQVDLGDDTDHGRESEGDREMREIGRAHV